MVAEKSSLSGKIDKFLSNGYKEKIETKVLKLRLQSEAKTLNCDLTMHVCTAELKIMVCHRSFSDPLQHTYDRANSNLVFTIL